MGSNPIAVSYICIFIIYTSSIINRNEKPPGGSMFDYFLKKTLMVSILYRVQLSRSFGNTTRTHASLDHQLTKKSLDGWTYEWNTYPPSGFNAYLLFIILYPFFFPLDLATFLRWYVQYSSQ